MSANPGWTNWSGSVCCDPSRTARPTDEAAVAALVAEAASAGTPLRVVGAGHSGTPLVATEGVLLSLDGVAGIESDDREELTAVVRAGTRLCDLGAPLLELGMGLENLGDIDKQALGAPSEPGPTVRVCTWVTFRPRSRRFGS